MEDLEVPTERIQEEIHHHAESSRERWISAVALSSALLAVFAAVAALLAGKHANEAMLEQLHASDHWSYYQAKGIKGAILASKLDLLRAQGHGTAVDEEAKLKEYREDQEKTRETAEHEEKL